MEKQIEQKNNELQKLIQDLNRTEKYFKEFNSYSESSLIFRTGKTTYDNWGDSSESHNEISLPNRFRENMVPMIEDYIDELQMNIGQVKKELKDLL